MNSSDSVSHGTACAAIALGANNSECSVGIAPGATLAGCPMLGRIGHGFVPGVPYLDRHVLSYRTDVNDISSNSWGIDACSSLQSRRALQSSDGTCPFSSSLSGSPCLAAACRSATSMVVTGWAMDGGTPANATECATAISGYCGPQSTWLVTDFDAACHDWWHLSYVCSYSDLSERDVFALQQATATGRGGKGTVFVFSAGNTSVVPATRVSLSRLITAVCTCPRIRQRATRTKTLTTRADPNPNFNRIRQRAPVRRP